MKLKKVQIKDFQSIRDSNEFEVGDITCLVGKNESGKTSLLQALYKLNPILDEDGEFDVTDNYPRKDVTDYQDDIENGNIEHSHVTTAIFILDDELEAIYKLFGNAVLENNEFQLIKDYGNKSYYNFSVNEESALNHIIKNANCSQDLKTELKGVTEFSGAIEKLADFESKEDDKELITLVQEVGNSSLKEYIYSKFIKPHTPKFLYFDSYYQLTGQENIEKLLKRIEEGELNPSDHPMLGLLSSAKIEVKDLLDSTRTQELVNKLEGAGNRLSKDVLKYWSQNKHLQMKFEVLPGKSDDPEGMQSGTNLWAKIYDNKRWVTTNLGSRSKGFVWFFSFLAWYSMIRKDNSNTILLLDEPGLSLHAKAQSDLLIYFEQELKPNNQLIYSTHSPFMIDPSHFDRVRIVEDKSIDSDEVLSLENEGTKVINDFSKASNDSLFPLQSALGYEIHQTLFVGPNILIVEGTSDLLYLQTMSGILERKDKNGLSSKWTITPVGGSDKIPTFIALLASQSELNIATLIDIQKNDVQKIENLYKSKLLEKNKVLTYADFLNQNEADIEDLLGVDLYLKIFNLEYKTVLSKQLKKSDLKSRSPRIVVKLEEYLRDKPLKKETSYSHYRPARYFTEHLTDLENEISDETIGYFEEIFRKLNDLLK